MYFGELFCFSSITCLFESSVYFLLDGLCFFSSAQEFFKHLYIYIYKLSFLSGFNDVF